MAAGTPAISDRDYTVAHPNWRESYHQMRLSILGQFRNDREACKRIHVAGQWLDSVGLTMHDLEDLADRQARVTLERCILRREDVLTVSGAA